MKRMAAETIGAASKLREYIQSFPPLPKDTLAVERDILVLSAQERELVIQLQELVANGGMHSMLYG